VHQVRLQVSSTARVYEVDSAADWHRLVQGYGDWGTHPGSDENLRDAAGLDNGPAPTWSRVAEDYQGVHLTFAGLLTGLYVPYATEEVSTALWAWNWESTYWLRSVFTSATPLEDLPRGTRRPRLLPPVVRSRRRKHRVAERVLMPQSVRITRLARAVDGRQ